MRRPEHIPRFSKALLAGALTGIIATIINLIYNVAFRSITKFVPDEEFNFFSITLASMIVLVLIGLLYFLCIRYISDVVFFVTIAILVIAFVCITAFAHTNSSEAAFYGDHGLVAGFIIIGGVLALTLLPYLYNHPKMFL